MTPRSISVAGFSRTAISLAVILSSSLHAAPVLEEVVVTATLKAESLQDVPVSVNAVGGEKLFESGIGKVEDLAAYVPNLTMSETGIGTNIYIRGIGSGINQGFEQSVGMYFDGVSYGRAQLSRSPFMDLQRVEVLRGPQNILLGKPSIAGSLGLFSNRPDEEFEAMVSLSVEPEYDEYVYDGVVSGKVSDNFGIRVAGRVKTTDGYIENLTTGENEPSRREETIRAVFDWTVSDSVAAWFKVERSDFKVNGRQIEIINDNPSVRPDALPGVPGFIGKTYGEVLNEHDVGPGGAIASIRSDDSVLNTSQDYKRSSNGDFSNNEVEAYIANVEMDYNEHVFTSITAFLKYDFDEQCDCDFTGSEMFLLGSHEAYEQISQEFRWISAPGETFDFIGGFYFQTSELEFEDQLSVPTNGDSYTNLPELINVLDIGAGNMLDGDPVNLAGTTYVTNLGAPREFTTDADLYSAFLQATWNMTDSMRLTFGGRYSYEKKSGTRKVDLVDFDTGESRAAGGTDATVANAFLAERHDLNGSRSESNFAPSINFQWDFGDTMMYMTLTRGFKSGGYDARSNASPGLEVNPNSAAAQPLDGSFEFDQEVSDSFEIGTKNSFFDGRWELNIAAFYTEYTDLQVSVFDGTLGFNVGNAGAATTMGIELDGRFAITDNLIMTYAAAILDFEFTDFEQGQCYQDRINAGRGWGDTSAPAPDSGSIDSSDGAAFCDYEGLTNQYAADFGGNVSFIYNKQVADNMELRGNFDVVFTTDYNSSQNLDPSQEQDGYAKINARVAVAHLEDNWDFAIVGKNLTNEKTISYSNDTPLANSSIGAVGHYGFVDSPRTIGFQITKRWY